MTFRTLILCAALSWLALSAPAAHAYQSLGGACSLEVRVNLADDGRITQRNSGTVRCAGMIGRQTVDTGPAPASVGGRARRGGARCAPALLSGSLRLTLRRLMSLDPDPRVTFAGQWRAAGLGPADGLSGAGTVEGLDMGFVGSARLVAANPGCTAYTLQMELAFAPR